MLDRLHAAHFHYPLQGTYDAEMNPTFYATKGSDGGKATYRMHTLHR